MREMNNFPELIKKLEKAKAHLVGATVLNFPCDWSLPPPASSIAKCVVERSIRLSISKTQSGCYEIIAEYLPK